MVRQQAGHRCRLTGGPADGQLIRTARIQYSIQRPEPHPGPDRPNPATYRISTDDHGRRLTNAAGELDYAYDWRDPDWPITGDRGQQ